MNNNDDDRKKAGFFILIVILATMGIMALISGVIGQVIINGPQPPVPPPETPFGNATINGIFTADAQLLEPEGEEEGGGIETMALSSEQLFDDTFESGNLNKWTSHSSRVSVIDTKSYQGDRSAEFNPRDWHSEYLKKLGVVNLETGSQVSVHFAICFSSDFTFSTSATDTVQALGGCRTEYFILKIEFTSGNTLVYIIGGIYFGGYSEAVIDIKSQVEDPEEWSVITIDNIEEDYLAHFDGDLPESGALRFEMKSRHGEAYIDSVSVQKTTEDPEVFYWGHDGQEVECFFIDVALKVTASDVINRSIIWANIKIWSTIYHEEEIVQVQSLIQDALTNVTDLDVWLYWRSACFGFPEDDTILGSPLKYSFDIKVEVFGEIKQGEIGNGTTIISTRAAQGFDNFSIEWTSGTMTTIMVIAIGGGSGSLGLIGAAKHRKKKKMVVGCDPAIDPNCSI